VKFYKDAGMWNDVLRISREYIPSKFEALQKEYEKEMSRKGPR